MPGPGCGTNSAARRRSNGPRPPGVVAPRFATGWPHRGSLCPCEARNPGVAPADTTGATLRAVGVAARRRIPFIGMNSHLAHTRKDRDLSQVELAELAATTQATVSRLEAGISRGYVETQVRLARALGVTVEAIFPYPDA